MAVIVSLTLLSQGALRTGCGLRTTLLWLSVSRRGRRGENCSGRLRREQAFSELMEADNDEADAADHPHMGPQLAHPARLQEEAQEGSDSDSSQPEVRSSSDDDNDDEEGEEAAGEGGRGGGNQEEDARPGPSVSVSQNAMAVGAEVEVTSSSSLHYIEEDGAQEEVQPRADWSQLPDIVLNEIFARLADGDRNSAALVCRKWLKAFGYPSLWRSRHLRFTQSCLTNNYARRATGFARHHGQHLKRLTLQCMHPTYSVAKKFQSCMTSFLHALNVKKVDGRRCELRELVVNQLHVERYWRFDNIRERLMAAVCRFLTRQRHLKVCDFSEMTLTAQDGLKLLETVGEAAGRRVHLLNLEDFFASRLAMHGVPRFRLAMSRFHNLSTFLTNYNYLSGELVEQLALNCEKRLKNLSVKAYRLDPFRHHIHPHSWRLLRRACPALRVCLYFEAIGTHVDITRIACPELPLKVLQVWTGMNQQQNYWRLSDTIIYMARHFGRTLEEACFYLENPQEEIDAALLYFLEQCRQLESLDIQAIIKVSTLETICDWQLKYKIGLQRLHVAADNMDDEDVDSLDVLVERHQEWLDERGLDFQLLANSSF